MRLVFRSMQLERSVSLFRARISLFENETHLGSDPYRCHINSQCCTTDIETTPM